MALYRRIPKDSSEKGSFADEFPLLVSVLRFIEERRVLLFWVGIGVILIIAIGWGNALYNARCNQRAQQMYDRIEDTSEDERLKAYEEIVERYPRADVAYIVRLELGKSAFEKGEYDKAISWYHPLTSLPDKKAFLRTSALNGIGAAFEMKGSLPEAAEYYQRAVADPKNVVKDLSLYSLARTYGQMGKTNEAVKTYEQAIEEGSTPSIQRDAEGRLIWIGRSK